MSWCSDAPEDEAISLFAGLLANPDVPLSQISMKKKTFAFSLKWKFIDCRHLFQMKCAEDCFCEYLGPDYMPLDYKFIVLDDNSYKVDQREFPRIKKSELLNGISKISYNLDISAITKFKFDLC
jgi:hypothetical protein